MAKRLVPLLDRVLVEKLQPATKTVGGILLPDTAVSKVHHNINKLEMARKLLNAI
jgi:chaperonin GroES